MDPMELARRRYVDALPFPKTFRPGKFTATGISEGKVCHVDGPGVMTRLWTTHNPGDACRMIIYVDDMETPWLEGPAHILARAASEISNPEIPLGGALLDKYSVNLYIPVRFEKFLRIDLLKMDENAGGTYWQVDYMYDTDWYPTPVHQQGTDENLRLVCAASEYQCCEPPDAREAHEEYVELQGCKPHNILLNDGPAIIRRIELVSDELDKLGLRMCFDGFDPEAERLDGPFQVDAPLRYLTGKVDSAAIERRGSRAIIHFPMPFRGNAGLQLISLMDENDFRSVYRVKVRIVYETDPAEIDRMYYFHAHFSCVWSQPAEDFECLNVRGRGHFVGVNIFDSGHNHGGGDNIYFDAGRDTAGQLHGVCGEDYFHHAFHWVSGFTPYAGCPTHGDRYRHHLEMPVPFEESFVFNWGSFAGQAGKAVAFWYAQEPWQPVEAREFTYRITGPFPLDKLDELGPGRDLPEELHMFGDTYRARSWQQTSQQGWIDLCHIHRRYLQPYSHSFGPLVTNVATQAKTAVYVAEETPVTIYFGCDDPARLYLNRDCIIQDEGRTHVDPYRQFQVDADLPAGLTYLTVAVGNQPNTNWSWNGFSLVLEPNSEDKAILPVSL